MIGFDRVLVLSAHPDDAELGAGGTIARFVRGGAKVRLYRLSKCVETYGETVSGQLLAEGAAAASVLGAEYEQADFAVRRFSFKRQAVLDALIAQREDFSPDLVIIHSRGERHQDHAVVHAEALRAFRCSMLAFDLSASNPSFCPQWWVKLECADLEAKLAALACYQTQAGRPYFAPDYIRGLARVRGVECGSQLSEAFEVIRLVS